MNSTEFTSLHPLYSTTRRLIRKQPATEIPLDAKTIHSLQLPPHPQRQGQGGLRTQGYFKENAEDRPLISFITVSCNASASITHTLESVLTQSYDNLEYLVIDGRSTDGTVDLIRKYEHAIDYWVSEPDRGMYDAMNKGIRLAAGEWIWILNADDCLEANAVEKVLKARNECFPDSVALYGCLRREFNGLSLIVGRRNLSDGRKPIRFSHPATLLHRSLYDRYGLFNTAYRYSSDYDFFTRLAAQGIRFDFIDEVLVSMKPDGCSDRIATHLQRSKEHFAIDRNHYGICTAVKYGFLSLTRDMVKLVMRKFFIRQRCFRLLRFYFSRNHDYTVR